MSSLFTVLAVLCFFPMILAGLMTFSALRDREYEFATKAGVAFAVMLFVVVAAPKGKSHPYDDCRYYGRFASDC